MITRKNSRQNQRGGAMIMALILTMVATVGFAAWTLMLTQRTKVTEQAAGGMARRLALESSNQFARAYMTYKVVGNNAGELAGTAPVPGAVTTPGTGTTPPPPFAATASGQVLAGVTAPAWTGYPMQNVTTHAAEFNPMSPDGIRKPYSANFVLDAYFPLMNGLIASTSSGMGSQGNAFSIATAPTVSTNASVQYTAHVKSRSPLLMDYQLVLHRPTLSPSVALGIAGNIDVMGGAYYFNPVAGFSSIRAMRVQTPSTAGALLVANKNPLNDAATLPSNMPSPIFSMGMVGGSIDLQGSLDVIEPVNNGGNSVITRLSSLRFAGASESSFVNISGDTTYSENGVSMDSATGILTVDLKNRDRQQHLIIRNHVASIILTGQDPSVQADLDDAESASSLGICYIQDGSSTRNLTSISCLNGTNNRRILLCIKKIAATAGEVGGGVDISFGTAVPSWRLLVVAENTPLSFTPAGGAGNIALRGGIQTDASLSGPTGSSRLVIEKDALPLALQNIAPRLAWVETHLFFDSTSEDAF